MAEVLSGQVSHHSLPNLISYVSLEYGKMIYYSFELDSMSENVNYRKQCNRTRVFDIYNTQLTQACYITGGWRRSNRVFALYSFNLLMTTKDNHDTVFSTFPSSRMPSDNAILSLMVPFLSVYLGIHPIFASSLLYRENFCVLLKNKLEILFHFSISKMTKTQ